MTYSCFNSDIPANLIVHTNTTLEAGSIFAATCLVVGGALAFTEIGWLKNEKVVISDDMFYTKSSLIHSRNLTLSPLNTSNAGMYTCETHVEDYKTMLIGTKEVNITVTGL